jgi:hypothetical protein
MTIVVRRKSTLRNQWLVVILLSVLAGLVGGSLVGLATGRHSSTPASAAGTT